MSFSLGLIDWALCRVVLSTSIRFGLYLAGRKKSSADSTRFFLNGRQSLLPLVGASSFASNIGAEHPVGLSGDAYRYGISAGTVAVATAWCWVWPRLSCSPPVFAIGVFTTADCGGPCRHDHAVCPVVTKKPIRQTLERLMIGGKARQSGFAASSTGACSGGGLTARTVLPIGGFGSHDGEPRFLGGKNRIKNMEKNDE